ncbi:MAG: hypothetical protein RIC03_04355 [Cyclobacteriaceae bacterium]
MNELLFERNEKKLQNGFNLVWVDILIDGVNLIDKIRDVELKYDIKIAGSYSGLTPKNLYRNLTEHSSELLYPDKRQILECECGCDGCWSFLTGLEIENDQVIWTNFEQVHRKDWNYEPLEPLKFGLTNYNEELEKLKNWS